jgi:hypothetical protein
MLKARVYFDINPKEMAEEFWEMDAEQQAAFFNRLGKLTTDYSLYTQMHYVREMDNLKECGLHAMRAIGRGI